ASFRSRGSIIDGVRKEDWLPRSSRERTKKLQHEIEGLEQKLMRHVTPEEIAEHLQVSIEEVYETIHTQYYANVLSLDEKIQEDDQEEQTFTIKDDEEKSPEEHVMMDELLKDRKSTRLNSSHVSISYAVFCLKKNTKT